MIHILPLKTRSKIINSDWYWNARNWIQAKIDFVHKWIIWFPRNPKHFILTVSDFVDVTITMTATRPRPMDFGSPLVPVGDANLCAQLLRSHIDAKIWETLIDSNTQIRKEPPCQPLKKTQEH